jgi:lysophospholipase L1-like esterase
MAIRTWAFRGLAILLGISAPLAAAEGYLRLTGVGGGFYEPDPVLGARLIPNRTGRWRKACFDVRIRISSQGLRDGEHSVEKPRDLLRIAVLGDSIAEALQVPLAQTFPRLLEARLNAGGNGPRFEVINFSVSGYGTDQMYLTLKTRAAAYRPDVVALVFTVLNDVRNNSPALERQLSSYPKPFFRLDAEGRLVPVPFRASAVTGDGLVGKTKAALRHLRLYDAAVAWTRTHPAALSLLGRLGLLEAAPPPAPPVPQGAGAPARPADPTQLDFEVYRREPDAQWAEAWRVTEALIRATRDEAKRLGAQFLLVPAPGPVELASPAALARAFPHFQPEAYSLAAPRDRLRRLAEAEGIEYLFIFDALAGDLRARNGSTEDYFFWCDGHLTPRAHELVAAAMAEAIRGGAAPPRPDAAPDRPTPPRPPGAR